MKPRRSSESFVLQNPCAMFFCVFLNGCYAPLERLQNRSPTVGVSAMDIPTVFAYGQASEAFTMSTKCQDFKMFMFPGKAALDKDPLPACRRQGSPSSVVLIHAP